MTFACVSPSPHPDLTAAEQAEWDGSDWDPEGETVVIEGGIDACWDAGLCFPGTGPEAPEDPIEPPGGGGDGGGTGPGSGDDDDDDGGILPDGKKPKPIPYERDCKEALDTYGPEECRACCNWNYDNVWSEKCRRMKPAPVSCWETAIAKAGVCVAMCTQPDEGILTGDLP